MIFMLRVYNCALPSISWHIVACQCRLDPGFRLPYNALQHTPTHSNPLQHTETHCNTMRCFELYGLIVGFGVAPLQVSG